MSILKRIINFNGGAKSKNGKWITTIYNSITVERIIPSVNIKMVEEKT